MGEKTTYEKFLETMAELADIGAAGAILSWDQETYMPDGAQQARGQQMGTLSALSHRKFTSDEMGNLLAKLQGPDAPEELDRRVAVERVAWSYARQTKLPESLVREMAEAQSDAVAAWTKARPANDFAAFRPHLEKLLDLTRQEADYLRANGQERYDALIDGYERGATAEGIATLFSELKDGVVPLVQEIAASPHQPKSDFLDLEYDPDRQWQFGLDVLKAMGFDFERGRQDKSAHPFTTAFHPTDVRITTRVHPKNFRSGLFSSVHEGGHGLYEQGIAQEDWRTPLGESISLGIHESQSRMWENLVGRSLPFWRHFYGPLQGMFPEQLGGVALEDFHRAINEVRRSLIRVEADEVTYSLHIILRFEIERAMLDGKLAPADLPEAWHAKVKEYLGLDVPDDKDGCMQDIHWAWGLVGYFPTYTLGNLYSVQFFNQARREIGDLEERIARGELSVLTEWLRAKIHRVGTRRLAKELVMDVTGEPLHAAPYVEYLRTKYSGIYRLA